MLEDVNKSAMTPERLRDYVTAMREAVEKDLVNEPAFIRIFLFKFENPKLLKLQARLQNYMLLEGFLMSPQRAKDQLEDAVSNIGKRMA